MSSVEERSSGGESGAKGKDAIHSILQLDHIFGVAGQSQKGIRQGFKKNKESIISYVVS